MAIGPTSSSTVLNSGRKRMSGKTEFIFMGTGTSSSLPHVDCLTAPPDAPKCRTCLSTLTPEGKNNVRRNTSGLIRLNSRTDPTKLVTIVIDVGKNFQAAAVEWFPKFGLRKIDAVLLTHAHADAMNGLDDLRGWTLGGAIQEHIDVYVSQDTFREVKRSFPYLVSKEFASGGGDVPQFVWHIIESHTPFVIEGTGIEVTPFSVHHGRIFTPPPPVETNGFHPKSKLLGNGHCDHGLQSLTSKLSACSINSERLEESEEIIQPYLSFGFKIEHNILYLSDVSFIPEDVWPILFGTDLCILDCLHFKPHPSHLALDASIETARRINSTRTYLTGFSHRVSHEEYVTIGEVVGGKRVDDKSLTEMERTGIQMIADGEPIWVRPGHDGLRIVIDVDGTVSDETYE